MQYKISVLLIRLMSQDQFFNAFCCSEHAVLAWTFSGKKKRLSPDRWCYQPSSKNHCSQRIQWIKTQQWQCTEIHLRHSELSVSVSAQNRSSSHKFIIPQGEIKLQPGIKKHTTNDTTHKIINSNGDSIGICSFPLVPPPIPISL